MYARFFSTVAVALMLAACGGGGYSAPPTTPSASPSPATTGATIAIPVGDGYGNSSFDPGNLTVAPGTSVTWSNRDTVAHTSTSTENAWNATIQPGGSYTRTFTDRGSFSYRCTIHAGMTGTVTVQ